MHNHFDIFYVLYCSVKKNSKTEEITFFELSLSSFKVAVEFVKAKIHAVKIHQMY